MSEPVIVAVPPKGGSLDDVFTRLVAAGWLEAGLVAEIRRLVREDKRRIKLEEGLIHLFDAHHGDPSATLRAAAEAGHDRDTAFTALARMRRWRDDDGRTRLTFTPKAGVDLIWRGWCSDRNPVTATAAGTLHLELDLGRPGRPTRVMFDHLEFDFGTVRGVLVGTEHEVTPTYLRRHHRDLSLTCYDAFHNTLLDALDTGQVHDWRELMDHLIEANTDVRILGSLGLDDYLGHCVLMPEPRARQVAALGASRRWNDRTDDPKVKLLAAEPLLIDANYEAIYRSLLDADRTLIRFEATTGQIEAAVGQGRSAIYVVRSGSTIAATPNVCVVGEELVTSETIIAVNQERMQHNRGVAVLADSLQPRRESHVAAWRNALAQRLGTKLV